MRAITTGSLALAPAALAGPVDPAAAPVGYGLAHSGHDHNNKADKPKPKKDKKHKKDKKDKKGHKHGDSAHAGGGYDSHRSHPRNW